MSELPRWVKRKYAWITVENYRQALKMATSAGISVDHVIRDCRQSFTSYVNINQVLEVMKCLTKG